MADTPTVQVYQNGFRNVVIGLTLQSDGSGLTGYSVFDATSGGAFGVTIGGQTFYPGIHTKLVGIDFDVQDMKFQLQWDANTPVPFFTSGASPEDFNWTKFGGLYPPAVGVAPGVTGSILLSTINAMPDATLTAIFYIRKGIHQ